MREGGSRTAIISSYNRGRLVRGWGWRPISNSSQGMQVVSGRVWFKELRGVKGAGQISPDYDISQGLQVGCDIRREGSCCQ